MSNNTTTNKKENTVTATDTTTSAEISKVENDVKSKTTEITNKTKEDINSLKSELEELRAFKAQVESERTVTAVQKENVVASSTFFGETDNIAPQKQKTNAEKEWEKLFKIGVPYKHE